MSENLAWRLKIYIFLENRLNIWLLKKDKIRCEYTYLSWLDDFRNFCWENGIFREGIRNKEHRKS